MEKSSVYFESEQEALRYKWIESEKAGRDLGDVAIRRWQRDTGGRAMLASTGECFDDIALRARPQDE